MIMLNESSLRLRFTECPGGLLVGVRYAGSTARTYDFNK